MMNTNNYKHYNTLDNYYKTIFGYKIAKIALNGGFTCPNRDGKVGVGGCAFCCGLGGNEFVCHENIPLEIQFEIQRKIIIKKWPNAKYIVYFGNYSSTYAPFNFLAQLYKKALCLDKDIVGISIATRPDCINEDIVSLLSTFSTQYKVTIELGLQTFNDSIAKMFNRCYETKIIYEAVKLIRTYNIDCVIHLINGLRYETKDSMINNAALLSKLDIQGVKFHMLYITKDSTLGREYIKSPFELLTLREYIEILSYQIRLLKPNIIIHRICGDGKVDNLLAPKWIIKKLVVQNELDKYMTTNNLFQGDLY